MTDLFYKRIFYSKKLNSLDITTNFQIVKIFNTVTSKILDNCDTLIFDDNGNVNVDPPYPNLPYINPLPNQKNVNINSNYI